MLAAVLLTENTLYSIWEQVQVTVTMTNALAGIKDYFGL